MPSNLNPKPKTKFKSVTSLINFSIILDTDLVLVLLTSKAGTKQRYDCIKTKYW